jgi:hypothetical protein
MERLRFSTRSFPGPLLLALAIALPLVSPAVELSMRDTTFDANDTLCIAVLADTIAPADTVLAYQFVLTFDSLVLTGAGAVSAGTIGEPFGDPFTSRDAFPGELRVAAAGTHPISGSGPLVTLLLRATVNRDRMTILQFGSGSVLFNEGRPAVTYADTLARVTVLEHTGVGSGRFDLPSVTNITVSPNPARDRITLRLPRQVSRGEVRLWNILGQNVGIFAMNGLQQDIALVELPPGLYFLTVDRKPEWLAKVFVIK